MPLRLWDDRGAPLATLEGHTRPVDGALSGYCSNDLAFLQLQHGNRRVTLDEAEALSAG